MDLPECHPLSSLLTTKSVDFVVGTRWVPFIMKIIHNFHSGYFDCRGSIQTVIPCSEKDSVTTLICIVFDCSCRESRSSACLNDCLKPSSTLLNDLCSIMCTITALLQIMKNLSPSQSDNRDYARFLWLSNPKNPEVILLHTDFKQFHLEQLLSHSFWMQS